MYASVATRFPSRNRSRWRERSSCASDASNAAEAAAKSLRAFAIHPRHSRARA
jgi:hypothetical protein